MKQILHRLPNPVSTTLILLFVLFGASAQLPTIASFTPKGACGNIDIPVFIIGTNFSGTTAVNIGGTNVDSFKINSPTSITAYKSSGSSGLVSVTTPKGTAKSSGNFTYGIGYSAYAYVANGLDNTVSVINTATQATVANVIVGNGPDGVSVSPDGTLVYVSDFYDNNINIISTATNTVIATVAIGDSTFGICASPDGTKVYVSNYNDNTVSVISTANDSIIANVPVGNYPVGICTSPDGKTVYVANDIDGTVSIINAAKNTVINTLTVRVGPSGLSVSPDGSKLYVANTNSNLVSIINTVTDSVIAILKAGSSPTCISFSPDGTRAYISNDASNTVSVIDVAASQLINTVAIGNSPLGIDVSPDGTKVYVVNWEGTISVINTATDSVEQTLTVGNGSFCIGNFMANLPSSCTLPVNIVSLEATNNGDGISIDWHTATEINTSYFVVQRSTNGKNFTDIGTVKAMGEGANSYGFRDISPNIGVNYYRLQSVDKDGAVDYSKVVTVQITADSHQLSVFPNPVRDMIHIEGNHIASIDILDNMGRVARVVTLEDASSQTLSVSRLPAGVYYVRVKTTDGSVYGVSFIKE